MRIIIGLGNPKDKYKYSRHNAGFMVVDEIAKELDLDWSEKKDLQSMVAECGTGDKKIIFVKPQTYMNLSGQAVQLVKNFYKLETSDITVIHDEVDLPFGVVKDKQGGGTAGHNGLNSVTSNIGPDYNRIRIGIRNELTDLVDTSKFVLANFQKEELQFLKQMVPKVRELLNV